MSDMFEEINAHLLALVLKNQLEILRILDTLTYLMNNPTSLVPMRVATPPDTKEKDNR